MMARSPVDEPVFRSRAKKLIEDRVQTSNNSNDQEDSAGEELTSPIIDRTTDSISCKALSTLCNGKVSAITTTASVDNNEQYKVDCIESSAVNDCQVVEEKNDVVARRDNENELSSALMGDGYVMMREQDADLLESIQILSNASILTTPSLSSNGAINSSSEQHDIIPLSLDGDSVVNKPEAIIKPSITRTLSNGISTINNTPLLENQPLFVQAGGTIPLPCLPETAFDMLHVPLTTVPPRHHRARSRVPKSSSLSTYQNFRIDGTADPETTTAPILPNNAESHSIGHNALQIEGNNDLLLKSPFRRALSGEVWSNELVDDQNRFIPVPSVIDDDVYVPSLMPRSQNMSSSISSNIRRTDSAERRMNEAAQFAEAVGEVFLPQNTTIEIIDDDDRHASDDDDDDDDHEDRGNEPSRLHAQLVDSSTLGIDSHLTENGDVMNLPPSAQPSWDSSRQRSVSEAVLFASAVGEYDVALQSDPTDTIRIIDDDDDEYNGQNLDDDEDDEVNNTSTLEEVIDNSLTSQREVSFCQISDRKQQPSTIESKESPMLPAESPPVLPLPPQQERSDDNLLLRSRSITGSLDHLSLSKSQSPGMTEQLQQGRFALSRRKNLSNGFLDKLPDDYNSAPATSKQLDFVYKGIIANPPEIVKRGTARGNYAQLHRKAWLEVSDKYHRYGKNLRLYYRYWESLGFPTNMFFDWLDSKGEAAGQSLPELEDCPRSKLDSDTVLYITNPQITETYNIRFVPTTVTSDGNQSQKSSISSNAAPSVDGKSGQLESNSRLRVTSDSDSSVEPIAVAPKQQQVQAPQNRRRGLVLDQSGQPVRAGPDGWIFVLRDNEMYGAPKITSINPVSTQHQSNSSPLPPRQQRFHHSSFFGGKAVAAAGIFITDDDGILQKLYPHSGHYRPGEAHMQRVLFYLYHKGIDLRTFEMDIQQILHIARGNEGGKEGTKEKCTKNSSKVKQGQDENDVDVNNKTTVAKGVDCNDNIPEDGNATDVKKPEKRKKIDSLHMMPAILVACFLAHKARFIGEGIFAQIHKIRKRGKDITTVTEALNIIDDGGCFWSSSAIPNNPNTSSNPTRSISDSDYVNGNNRSCMESGTNNVKSSTIGDESNRSQDPSICTQKKVFHDQQ